MKESASNEKIPSIVPASSTELAIPLQGFWFGVGFSVAAFLGFHFVLLPMLVPEYRDKLGTLNPGGRNGVIFNSLSPDKRMRVQMVQLPGGSDRSDIETRIYKQDQDSPVMVYRSIPANYDFAGSEVILWTKDSSHFIILEHRENNSYTIDSWYDVRSNQLLIGGCGDEPLVPIYQGDPEPRDRDLNPRYCKSPKKTPPQPLLTRQDIKKMEWINPIESLLE